MSDPMQQYLDFAKEVALEAGALMQKYFARVDREWKQDKTPLTVADTEINSMVIDRISEKFPSHSVLGEEESISRGGSWTWVCDPVDGTMPFSHEIQISTFSLALCKDGIPQLGVVYDPYMKRLFWGTKNGGAFCNDKQLKVNSQAMENALIDLEGIPSTKAVRTLDSHFNETLISNGAQTLRLWSAILPCALIAAGQMSAVIFNVPKPEDGAAIKVIIEEAGGKVTDLIGREQRYDQPVYGFIASNGVIHDELIRLVKENSDEV